MRRDLLAISCRGFLTAILVALVGHNAFAQEPPPLWTPAPTPALVVEPGHLQTHRLGTIDAGARQFDDSVAGLRSYLESIRSTSPEIYLRLDPELGRLEAKRKTATIILVGGLALGTAATIYAFAGAKDCSALDTSGASRAAWSHCNDDNFDKTAAFTLIGASSVAVGLLAWFLINPDRSDLIDFVNDHNRLSPRPLRWDLGYDPQRQLAYARVIVDL